MHADGRPVILKNRKTAKRFIAEMGMGGVWKIEEGLARLLETRGKKAKDDEGARRALVAWAMMKPKKRPVCFEDQRKFMERFRGTLIGNPKQKRVAVRAFIKKIQRLHQKASGNPSISELLST